MARQRLYPRANHTVQWRGNRPEMDRIDMLLLHTTESSSWPSYPSFAPTLTFNPWVSRANRWRQHYYINQAATTLKSFDDYKTNRQNVCQIEIVCWVDPNRSGSSTYYTKISDDAYRDLAEFYAWLHGEWGTEISSTVKWIEYRNTRPSSYGINNGVRLSRSQFTAYKGLCGHMHAPDQNHGDPSLVKVGTILQYAREIAGGDMALSDEDIEKIANRVASKFSTVWKSDEVKVIDPPEGYGAVGQKWSTGGGLEFALEKLVQINNKLPELSSDDPGIPVE